MCGIVGYVGERNSLDVLMGGLRRLEYRGYDSAGIAVIDDRHSCRVVATVLEATKASHKDVEAVALSDVSDDSTHGGDSTGAPLSARSV